MTQAKKGWWGRNWKWFVPVGCLGMIVLLVGLIAALATMGYKMITSSVPYKTAVATAQADPRVVEALGSPVKAGWRFNGRVSENRNWSLNGPDNSTGHVNLRISISGPKAEGTIRVYGDKSAGKWTFSTMTVTVLGQGKIIDLNDKPPSSGTNGAKVK